MGKLRLKRTPEEQAAHDLRKSQKRARKRRRSPSSEDHDGERDGKQRKADADVGTNAEGRYDFVFDCDDTEDLPRAHGRAHKPDLDHIRAQVEEERFREKLAGAFDDDERLDSVEARLNAFAHVPRRWRGGGMERMDDELDINPQAMEEDDYAEWVRAGMWRKKHAAEHAEMERKKMEQAARREREKALREETARMEKADEERRRQRRLEKDRLRWDDARAHYESRWKDLLGAEVPGEAQEMRFEEVPWPVLVTEIGPTSDAKGKARHRFDGEDITMEAVSTFLVPGGRPAESSTADRETMKKERRDKLRETMLRFHPDKFEGRVMRRVREKDRERAREAVGRVARIINDLLAGKEP